MLNCCDTSAAQIGRLHDRDMPVSSRLAQRDSLCDTATYDTQRRVAFGRHQAVRNLTLLACSARYTIDVVLRSLGSEKENRFRIDANFLFHGTWLAAYEHTRETLKAYIGRIAGIASNGVVGRKNAPVLKKRVRQHGNGGLPHERVEL